MMDVLGYFLLGLVGILIQTAVAPALLPLQLRPELLLILVIFLGLYRQGVKGGLAAYLVGLLQDSFAGTTLGLFGLIFLVLYLLLRGLAERLNTEPSLALLFMVLCGTLTQALLLVFLLGFFGDAGHLWPLLPRTLPRQVLLNLVCAWLLLESLRLLRGRRLSPRS